MQSVMYIVDAEEETTVNVAPWVEAQGLDPNAIKTAGNFWIGVPGGFLWHYLEFVLDKNGRKIPAGPRTDADGVLNYGHGLNFATTPRLQFVTTIPTGGVIEAVRTH